MLRITFLVTMVFMFARFDPAHADGSCGGTVQCPHRTFGSGGFGKGGCLLDCAAQNCGVVNSALTYVRDQAFAALNQWFNNSQLVISRSANLSATDFLDGRWQKYQAFANAVSQNTPCRFEGWCEFTVNCPREGGAVSGSCWVKCEVCFLLSPGNGQLAGSGWSTGSLIDLIHADYHAMLSDGAEVGTNGANLTAVQKSELCAIGRAANSLQGCSPLTGSSLCDHAASLNAAASLMLLTLLAAVMVL